MNRLLLILIMNVYLTIATLIAAQPEKPVFSADFNQSTEADTVNGPLKMAHKRQVDALTDQDRGFKGRGALFMLENFQDFKSEQHPGGKPLDSLVWHLPQMQDLQSGMLELMVKPYFNQIRPYPGSNGGLKIYYMFIALDNATRNKSLAVFILGETLMVNFRLNNGQQLSLTCPVKDWKPQQWHKITLSWTPQNKVLFIDGQRKVFKNTEGSPEPFNIIMVGGASGGCNFQGIIDEITLTKTALEISKPQPVIQETFKSAVDFAANWEVYGREGAEFKVSVKPSEGPDKQGCLAVEKTNAKGFVQIRYRHKLQLKTDCIYQFRGFYNTQNAGLTNIGFFRIQDGKDGRLFYDDRINVGYVHSTFSQLVNSSVDKWIKTLYYYTPQQPGEYYLNYVLHGEPCSLRLSNIIGNVFEDGNIMRGEPVDRKPQEKLISEETLWQKLKARKAPNITMQYDGKYTRMYVDGKFYPQVFHRSPPLHPELARFGELEAAGIKFHTLTLAIGGPDRFSIIKERGNFDFAKADQQLIRLLRAAPDSYIILNFSCWPYKNWNKGKMNEVFQNRAGLYGVSSNLLYVDKYVKEKAPSEYYYPSYYAKEWRDGINECITAYLKHLKQTDLFKAVGGFFITGGVDGQFMNNTIDYSVAGRQAFSEWLRKKYGTLEQLRNAWNNPNAKFEFSTPAELPDWPTNMNKTTFLNPKTDTCYADFQEFRSDGILATLNNIAEKVRHELGTQFPGYISICDDMNGTGIDTYSMSKFCRQNFFNGASPQPRYNYRYEGRLVQTTSVLDSMRIHRKFNILELDLRTYTACEKPSEVNEYYVSFAQNPESFMCINRKLTGPQIAKGHGFWYYDMAASYFYDPPLMDEIKKTFEITREVQEEKDFFTPGVAMIFDEKSVFWCQYRAYVAAVYYNTNLMQMYTRSSGVPYDIYFLDDLLSGKVKVDKYKMLVFLNAFRLTQEQCTAIDKLKSDKRTLVWMYAPGYVGGKEFSLKAVKQLTGFKVNTAETDGRHLCYPSKSGDSLTSQLEPIIGLVDMKRSSCDYPASGYGKNWDIQRFWLEKDPGMVVLANYAADGKAAIGVKRFQDWTSVYVAVPSGLSAQLMNNLASETGAYVFSKPGLSVTARGNFVSIHAIKSGTYKLNFPVTGKIVWQEENQVLNENGKTATINIEAGETRWYRIYGKNIK